jgi:hypothetical protein
MSGIGLQEIFKSPEILDIKVKDRCGFASNFSIYFLVIR